MQMKVVVKKCFYLSNLESFFVFNTENEQFDYI